MKHELLEVMHCGGLNCSRLQVLRDKTLFQQTQVWPDLAVGDCSRRIDGGVKGYETG